MPKCSCCGRKLEEKDRMKWRECRYCGLPVCFNCLRYIGVSVRDLFQDYIEVVGVCKSCKPGK